MKIRYKVIGSMSGTSLDGLDLAYCVFEKKGDSWKFEIIKAVTIPYPSVISRMLQAGTSLTGIELLELDIVLGEFFAEKMEEFIQSNAFTPDFISSHGHTIFHQPEKLITYQVGNGQLIANRLGLPVVNDFRSADVLAGGQGAPLVPIGDKLLFEEHAGCLNLGGIANISFDHMGKRLAYDICPTNMVLNALSNQLALEYDPGGQHASKGTILEGWLKDLNELAYYALDAPKSLGFEWVEEHILKKLDLVQGSTEDKLHTFVEHISLQIASELNKYVPIGNVLVTGGGTHNSYLLSRIRIHTGKGPGLTVPSSEIINYKEALIFGFLGVLRWSGEVNVLASVTGAPNNHSSGTVSHPMV